MNSYCEFEFAKQLRQQIRSVSQSQNEILDAIETLYCINGFECDLTFGNGAFYKNRNRPTYCFDIEPLHSFVKQSCSTATPLQSGSISTCVFDPPFLTYVKNGREHKNGKVAMTKRFGGYYHYSELENHYQGTLKEAHRILKQKGILVFKCQDIIHNHKMHCTHNKVINMAELVGFRIADIFVLVATNRMPGPQAGIQRHARIFHSYFLVFQKH